MAVAALDTYMHRLVVERGFAHDELPNALADLTVPFGRLVAQADETRSAARRPAHNSRPRVGVKRQLRNRLLRETFQRFDDIARGLGMIDRSGRWSAIAAQMGGVIDTNDLRRQLNTIVDRRNQIVHEGDYLRLDRPQSSKRNAMTSREARQAIEFVARFIDSIHAAI
jgi:hypothetical protein